jgi:hypothetical protein
MAGGGLRLVEVVIELKIRVSMDYVDDGLTEKGRDNVECVA